jgi:hypothetical protein
MSYWFVEYARAKRALVIALILLGIFFAACVALRISVHGSHWEATLENSPTAHVTRTALADGSQRIVVDDPQRQTHAVIVKHPNGGMDFDVTEPRGRHSRHGDFIMGSTSVTEDVQGNTLHTRLHYANNDIPRFDLGVLFLVTIPMGLIVASILGGMLAKENDGHLELAWTKPVSRERYALEAIAVDAAAIVCAQLLTIAVTLLATLMFFVPRFGYEQQMGWDILYALAGPIAWYALITAASASVKRGPGMVIGLGWVLAIIIPSLAAALRGAAGLNAVAAWFYTIFNSLSYIDPIAYMSFSVGRHSTTMMLPLAQSAGVLCALVAGYVVLAVAQWRRVEA